MIDTLEQFDRAEEAIAKLKQLLLVVRCTHTPEAYGALSTPILQSSPEFPLRIWLGKSTFRLFVPTQKVIIAAHVRMDGSAAS